jgi:hypothetical protein
LSGQQDVGCLDLLLDYVQDEGRNKDDEAEILQQLFVKTCFGYDAY